MSLRGVYREGVVFLEGDVSLPEGSLVRVSPTGGRRRASRAAAAAPSKRTTTSRAPARTVRLTKRERLARAMAVCGTWSNRRGWSNKSAAQIARELRTAAARRGRNG